MAIEKVINITTNAKQSIDTINKLYSKLQEADKAQEALNEEAKEMGEVYKDASKESIKSVDKQAKGLKGLTEVSKGTKSGIMSINNALKSLGIIGLIVALVSKLSETFRENQKVVDFVNTTFTAVSIITNDLINKFTDIFSKISEATGGFDALGAVVGGVVKIAFNQLKIAVLSLQAGFTALKLAYEKVFGDDEGVEKAKKDLDEIGVKLKETAEDSVEQGKKVIKNVGEAVGEVVDGVTILAKDGAKAISEIDAKAAFSQAEAITRNKKNFELLALQQARLQLSFQNQAELERQVRDDTSKSLAERIKANDNLGKILDKQFQAEKATIQARIQGLLQEQKLLGFSQERYNEIYQLQTDLIDVEERLNGARSEQLVNTTGLLQEQNDLLQSQKDTQNEIAVAQKEFDAEQQETELLKLEKLKEKIALEEQIALEEIERKRELYALDTQNRVDAENEYALKKQELEQATLLNSKAIKAEEDRISKEQSEKDILYKQLVKDATISLAGQTLDLLGSLAKEGGALAKGVAVAQAVMSTYQGINKALAETTDVTPTQTLRFANAAAVGVAGLLNVKKILSTKPIETGGGSVSGSSAPTAPAAPSFNLVQGTGSNQIAESLATERQPLQAYVVASNVTSAQELDRNAINEASIG